MKKLFTILLFVCLKSGATNYYISRIGNDAAPGTTIATAWKTLIKVNSFKFLPGDSVLFRRGDKWIGNLTYYVSSGVSGNPITFGAYGTGPRPIITTRTSIPGWNISGNWKDQGSNIWKWTNVSNPRNKSFRIWLNGVEYNRAATGATVTSIKRTNHLISTNDVYVYATSNPATFYSNIEYSGTDPITLWLSGVNYITVENLDIRAGGGSSIILTTVSNIIIQDCSIGLDAQNTGIDRQGTCNDVTIRRDTIDSGDRFEHDFQIIGDIFDGITLGGGCNRWQIYQNIVKDWGHANINLTNLSTVPMTDNEVYDNLVSGQDVDYCRGIGADCIVGTVCTGNKIYRNIFENHSVRIQLNLNGLEFSNNTVNNTRNCIWQHDSGEGIFILGYSGTDPRNMKIINNTITNNAQAGLWIGPPYSGAHNIIQGNIISNNIFLNNGRDAINAGMIGLTNYELVIFNSPSVLSNTFENNIFFGTGDIIYYGQPLTVKEFNKGNIGNKSISIIIQ